jgi:hypothetical protein
MSIPLFPNDFRYFPEFKGLIKQKRAAIDSYVDAAVVFAAVNQRIHADGTNAGVRELLLRAAQPLLDRWEWTEKRVADLGWKTHPLGRFVGLLKGEQSILLDVEKHRVQNEGARLYALAYRHAHFGQSSTNNDNTPVRCARCRQLQSNSRR